MSVSIVNILNNLATELHSRNLIHLLTEDEQLTGNKIHVDGKELVHFGSCSYLGLEFDERMIDEAKKALDDYGTQFSSSRAYISMRHYKELEDNFEKIFGYKSILNPTTTLAHISAIPALVSNKDAVILDHQVHNSVHMAVSMVKSMGTHVELIRHNRMDMLEERLKETAGKYEKVWYMADGIYSMFGDAVPLDDVYRLLDTYAHFHFYVDDAHGMSCYGKHGEGYVLSKKPLHPKMVMATSLAKAFATGGAVLVFPDEKTYQKVRNVGGPLITSGPLQPATLGAALAATRIHLSDEITEKQEYLSDNIRFANMLIKEKGLPVVAETDSPVFFIPVSLPKVAYNLLRRMTNEGYFLNLGGFPAVPIKNTGIRFTITTLHNFEQIENMLTAMAYHYPKALAEEGFTIQEVLKAFRLDHDEKVLEAMKHDEITDIELDIDRYESIDEIPAAEWNALLANRGAFDHHGLQFLEKVFRDNPLREDNWDFDYVIIRGTDGKPIVGTFFTTTVNKDDMLAPAVVSEVVEKKRTQEGKYYLTSRMTVCGSLLTEGDHLYIDKSSPHWKQALNLLMAEIETIIDRRDSEGSNIRDLSNNDEEVNEFLGESGYFKVELPASHWINLGFKDEEDYYNTRLSQRSRKHYRHDIRNHAHKFTVSKVKDPTDAEIRHLYKLYLNTKGSNLEINTFDLPFRLFEEMVRDNRWHILTMSLRKEAVHDAPDEPVAAMFNFQAGDICNFMLIGLDYEFNRQHNVYRQAIARNIQWANSRGFRKLALGFGSDFEKRKLGASYETPVAFMQLKDNFNLEVIGHLAPTATARH